jgi:hypothetical protein
MLKFGETVLAQDDEARMRDVSDDDRRRYDLALRKYREFYEEPRAVSEE